MSDIKQIAKDFIKAYREHEDGEREYASKLREMTPISEENMDAHLAQRARERREAFTDILEFLANGNDYELREVANFAACDYVHRTLQDSFFQNFILRYIIAQARKRDGFFDARNKGIVHICREIAKKLDLAYLVNYADREEFEQTIKGDALTAR